MAEPPRTEQVLADHPELRPLMLTNVRLTEKIISYGTYGSVMEVIVAGAIGAAKLLRPAAGRSHADGFVRECQLMSVLRHPNIVQFLGVAIFPGYRMPALVMEKMESSLHDMLETDLPFAEEQRFPLCLKCSILHNVACGLAYLHERSPPIIHRDLSARNVLLEAAGVIAKIADLGVACTLNDGSPYSPGNRVYMPPEAFESAPAFDRSIDIFSFGIITLFTVGETFPFDPLPPTYVDKKRRLVARSELERRIEYMQRAQEYLSDCGQLRGDHPLIQLIQQCLHNLPAKRPGVREVLSLVEEARAGVGDEHSNGKLVLQHVRVSPLSSYLKAIYIIFKQTLQQNLEKKEDELSRKEAELSRAEETIRREQQQIQEMRQRVSQSPVCVCVCVELCVHVIAGDWVAQ